MDPDGPALDHIEALLRQRQAVAAQQAATKFTALRSERVEGHILLGRALSQQGDFVAALRAVEAANMRVPRHPAAVLLFIECLLQTGERQRALQELQRLEHEATTHPRLMQDVGALYSSLNLHVEAERCYARTAALTPQDPQALYNWASCLIAFGRLDEAEELLTRVIAISPGDYDAYYNRSTLRRQTAERNHVQELEHALLAPKPSPNASIALGYALAKELEDLGRYTESFAALKRAADGRRRLLSYRIEDDAATMTEIAHSFDARYCRRTGAVLPEEPGHKPVIFIVGLPRSGTTLVDRILSSHSRVRSHGESSDLAASVMQMAGPVPDRTTLIRKVAELDAAALGRDYCARLPVTSGQFLIDKTPINFLYLGLIAQGLPQARIVHIRRQPIDVCYAMYKTLFRMAYPFSYDLGDLARYYLAYAALMQHWREALGERIIEVDYEDLVSDQENASRRLLQQCGLGWEQACLNFHRNTSPSLTASAAQVRKPVYQSSIGLWRRYERELQPLISQLRNGGAA